ncbi:FAD-dependent oxidoreductase [Desulfuromonas sp. TF]|uniref:FAD-dependent oxidoreductase n=1 Tax=Desulfuromonas sp. TF TaxID=1232410 RepID=UPI0003FB9E46|nr:FAD-dependent oxidoreductase [Desulfuromonas sp. TF]
MATTWDKTAEVVVIGYGGAGATAAIAAHDAGASVLILESTDKGGGNTLVSFGGFMYPENLSDAFSYLKTLYEFSHSDKDDELLRIFAEESAKTVDWLKSLYKGLELQVYGGASYPDIKGASSIKRYVIKGLNKGATAFAQNLWQMLSHAVQEQRAIQILTQTPAKRLVTNRDGAVIGVIALAQGKEIAIRAQKGVVLATGGYEFDSQTIKNNIKGDPVYSLGHPGNRGDGLRMAQKVGAKLWHMNGVSCAFGMKVPEFESALLMDIGNAGQIFVDKSGKRFINERAVERHAGLLAVDFFDTHSLEYPRIPFYLIFDEVTRRRGPISRKAGLGSAGIQYAWSTDNSEEIKKGWIQQAETLPRLAQRLNINETTLVETIERWNEDTRQGKDTLYGRETPDNRHSATIENQPFYAMEVYPCLLNTQGGPRRNEKAQVVDVFDAPIPGLYSAGELGSMWGLIYQGGGNIAECLAFGRIAGTNAAREKFSHDNDKTKAI